MRIYRLRLNFKKNKIKFVIKKHRKIFIFK
jgi:hypothetical protein